MRLHIVRHTFHRAWTQGTLYVNYVPFCYTLEDADRLAVGLKKIPGITAIPTGDFAVRITHSAKFRRPMPIIEGVEGFTGVRIHAGNTASDTEGCPILGYEIGMGRIRGGTSSPAFEEFYDMLEQCSAEQPHPLTIQRIEAPFVFEKLMEAWSPTK